VLLVTAKVAAALKQVRFTQQEGEFIYGVVLKYLKDKGEAHDVAQDALLLAFRYRNSFRGEARFTTWLYRIAASAAFMHLRRARRRPATSALSLADVRPACGPGDGPPSPEELMSSGETVALCERIAAEMGSKYAPLLRMRVVEGCSQAEIAHKLGLELGTVRVRTHRVLARIKQRLLEEEAAPGLHQLAQVA